jgi:hypothetical protein
MMIDRKAIHIDLNPMCVFIVKSLVSPVEREDLLDAFLRIKKHYKKRKPLNDADVNIILDKYFYPQNITLPKNSDVATVEKLFSRNQLAELALLRHFILSEKNENVRDTLLLMFSGLLNKINLTYHASKKRTEGQGDSAIFRYYRYRIAKEPATLDIMTYFESRFKKVWAAKEEIRLKINQESINNIQIRKGSATKHTYINKRHIWLALPHALYPPQ